MRIIPVVIFIALLAMVMFSGSAMAAENFTYSKLVKVAENLADFVLKIAMLAVTATIIYFGVRMVIAGSDTAAYGAARTGLNWALIGALVIFGVYTIIATIQGAVESVGR